jgi:UDP-N-acetylmuramyl pentapeptide phosphotransferase/UDP-N-acetylglucosamine-1-phosphate transferase
MTRGSHPIVGALLGAAATAAVAARLRAAPPGGAQRWARINHRGEDVSLLAGPATAAGSAAAVLVAPGLDASTRLAGLVAVGGSGALGTYDDLSGSGDRRGLRGHLGALAHGELTTGAVKVLGIGASGLVAGALLRRRAVDAVLAGGVVAGTANLVNLLDLRPGRAAKAVLLLSCGTLLRGGPGATLAGVAAGSAAAALPDDLGERTMLGDAGANALGALVGAASVAGASRRGLVLRLGVVVALTLASEKVSFTRVIESTPGLRELDRLGRR